MLADCLHIKDGSHIYDRSCQRPEVGEGGGGGLDDKSKPGIWFLNQFKTDAMATFSFLTDSYLHLGRLAYFFLSNPVIGLHGLFDFCFVLAG